MLTLKCENVNYLVEPYVYAHFTDKKKKRLREVK